MAHLGALSYSPRSAPNAPQNRKKRRMKMTATETLEALRDAHDAMSYMIRLLEVLIRDGFPSNADMEHEISCAEAQVEMAEFLKRIKSQNARILSVVKEDEDENTH